MKWFSTTLAFTLLWGPIASPAGAADKDRHGFLNRIHKDADGKESKYVVFVPHDYKGDKPYPLLLFLHSSSERGDDGQRQVGPLGNAIRAREKTFPFITVFPQSGFHWRIESKDTKRALAILADVQKEFNVDDKRLYVTGISIGGHGTCALAMEYPKRWAAIVPIAGAGFPTLAAKLKDVPCWCFQGADDSEAFVKSMRDMVAEIRKAGGNPKYTEYPHVGHNCWEKAYATPELWDWLLKQKRKSGSEKPPTATEPGVTVLTTFPGDTGPGPKDAPDNSGAVGPNHVVDFTNANVVIHDKKTGRVIRRMTQTEFWKNTKPAFDFPKLNDPRLLYDPLSRRWFAVAAEFKKRSLGYLAVSESSDPTKGWRAVKLPMEPTDPGMKLGVDKNGLYIAFYVLTGNTHTMMSVHAIPIADAVAPDGPSLARLQTFSKLEIECFPATDLNPKKAPDAPAILLNHEFGNSFSKMFMYKITWAGNTASISKMQTIPLRKTYTIPNAVSFKNQAVQPTPGDKLRADEGRRTLCVYQHGDRLFTCNEAKRGIDSRCGVFWCEIRATDGALLQEGFVDDPDCDYLVPSLAVDAHGNVGLGCTRTSAKEYPSACVMMHAAKDPPNTMRPAVLAAKGTTIFSSNRESKYGLAWGNYNSTCVDPSDPTILWTYQQYATSSTPSRWTTCWIAFKRK